MIFLFLASQLAAPMPKPQSWLRNNDYPIKYVEAGRSFDVLLRTTVRPDGTVQDCAIERSSGEVDFDRYNCALLIKRVKFKPASDAAGRPALGVVRSQARWVLDQGKATPAMGDIELTVAKLPAKLKSPTLVAVAIATDAAGRTSDCVAIDENQHAALVKAACRQLVKSYRAIPARSPAGEPLPSIQNATVTFRTQ